MSLQESRKRIDSIDEQIVTLLNRRAAVVREIGQVKSAAGIPVVDSAREAEIYRRITAENFGQIDNDGLMRIFERIVEESRRIQIESTWDIAETEEAMR